MTAAQAGQAINPPRPFFRLRHAALGFGLGFSFALACIASAEAQPNRIVSINLCADQYALLLAPERTLSVSFLARDPSLSALYRKAQTVPINRGRVEELLALKPDLVLAGEYGATMTVRLLKARGLRVATLPLVQDFNQIKNETLRLGSLLNSEEKASALLSDMEHQLQSASPSRQGPRAILLAPNGYASGVGTLGHATLEAAGFQNGAATAGLKGYVKFGLERLLKLKPDWIVTSRADERPASLAESWLNHPSLDAMDPAPRRLEIEAAWLACGTPLSVQAVTALRQGLNNSQ